MKKLFYTMGALLLLASCTEDYKDWTSPQVVEQPVVATFTEGGAIERATGIDFNVADEGDTIYVCSLNAPTSSNPAFVPVFNITLGSDDNAQTFNFARIASDGKAYMHKPDLVGYVEKVYGKAPNAHKVPAVVHMWLNDGETNVKMADSNSINVEVKLAAPFIDEGYWLVGDFASWDATGALPFTHVGSGNVYDNPVFVINFTTTADNQYWKIIPQNNYEGDFWKGGNDGVVGPANDGDDSMSGNLTTASPGAGKINAAGMYRMTINMMDYTYTIEPIAFADFIYEIGNSVGWSQSMPLYGENADGKYQGYYYLDGGYKFKPNADNWDGDWGQDPNGAFGTLVQDGEQDCQAEAGFYQIDVDLSAMTYSVTKVSSISIIGTVNGNWDTDTDMTYNTATGAWEVTTDLNAGAMKFRMNHDWTISWGGANGDPKAYGNLTQHNGKDLDLTAGGTYFIQLFISYEGNNKVVITKK